MNQTKKAIIETSKKTLLCLVIFLSLLSQACGGSGSGAVDAGTSSPDASAATPPPRAPALDPMNTQEPPIRTPDAPDRPPASDSDPAAEMPTSGCDVNAGVEPVDRLIAELDTLPDVCAGPLSDAVLDRIDSGQITASEVIGLILGSVTDNAEPKLQFRLLLLDDLLTAYRERLADDDEQQILEALIAVIIAHPESDSPYPDTAVSMLSFDFEEQCASFSGTPDCLDAAAAVFGHRNNQHSFPNAVYLYRSVLLQKTSLGDPQTQHLIDLVAHEQPLFSAEGASIAADLFYRSVFSDGSADEPPEFALSDTQIASMIDALIAAFDDRVAPPDAAVRTTRVANALFEAYFLVSPREDYRTLFAGLSVPVKTIERRIRLMLEATYLMPRESCTYTTRSGMAVTVHLFMPTNTDARSVADIRSCETYRVSTDFFLDTVGDAFSSLVPDVPDTDPSIYYIGNSEIHELYLDVYLQRNNVGGLFQRFWSLTGDERYNAVYISSGVASRHVAAHEFTHYLFGQHVQPSNTDYGPVMHMINEGLAEYVAYHAFGGAEPVDATVSRVCDYPPPYPTLLSILEGDSFGLDYDEAYVYVYFLINRQPDTFRALLSTFRSGESIYVDGSELVIGSVRIDIDELDESLHALFDSETFCGAG